MNPELIGLIGVIVVIVFIFMGVWIGAALAIVGLIGYSFLAGIGMSFIVAGTEPFSQIGSYSLSVIPMFLLMSAVVSNTGVASDLFSTANIWLGKIRGGLAIATVFAAAGFSAICGSSTVTALAIGKISLPEMQKYRYASSLASGAVAAGGTMGSLIPPSMPFVLYGLLTEQSISKLFIAGLIPGILQAVFYMVTVWIICRINPKLGPSGDKTTFKTKVKSLQQPWPMMLLFCAIMGGIYTGYFTATEAGAFGAFFAIIICLASRKLTWKVFKSSSIETAKTSAVIGFLMIGAFIFLRLISLSRLADVMTEFIIGLNVAPIIIIILIVLLYIIIGCFFDMFAAILLTVPILYPVVISLGYDPIWFGVLVVRVMEIGMITPPFGMNLFVLNSITDIPITTMFRGVIPFIIADVFHIGLLISLPSISLFLPNMM
ncbi:MAG: TRAP transporter large permease [Dehalococcoidales bacterium]|nr:TRAP transporter large permease [Dehalococcoidales bacterium]